VAISLTSMCRVRLLSVARFLLGSDCIRDLVRPNYTFRGDSSSLAVFDGLVRGQFSNI